MTRKTTFFERWSWLKFNNLGLALGTNVKFYISVPKRLKLKVRKFWELTPTFVEVTGEKMVRGHFAPLPPPWPLSWINKVQYLHFLVFFILLCALSWSWEMKLSDKWLRLIEKANFSHQIFVFIFQWME